MKISMKREQNSACIGSAEREKFGAKLKTKNIFKALALAMLMPAMLLTTACSNEDDALNNTANTENTINKGYALPVTVNVTRQGDAATRATYNDGTKKLSFSTGDKLFVQGSHIEADRFAGMLEWTSGGTFSGTIYTQNSYSGTAVALFEGGSARLLPAGYETPGYLSIENSGTFNASISCDASKAFATTKAIAVEQFSYEMSTTYSSGFALSPWNAILNFTITGLAASTEVTASFTDDSSNVISGNVTTDGSGNATFAIGVAGDTNLQNCSLTVGGNAITLTSSNKYLTAGKIYNITRSAAPALTYPIALGDATSDYVGSVVTTDGNVYATVAAASAASETAVAMIAYVSGIGQGLAIALADEAGEMNWNTAITTAAAHTPAVTGGTWRLPSARDWQYMFIGCGSGESYSDPSEDMKRSYSGLASKLTTAGGTALQKGEDYNYWSSSEYFSDLAWSLRFVDSDAIFLYGRNDLDAFVRAGLAFGYARGHALASSAVGEIVGSDGLAYYASDKNDLPLGVTAVGMVAYKSETAGESLAIQLNDSPESMSWSDAKTYAEGLTAVPGGTWKLPTKEEWNQMFSANGGSETSYAGLNTTIDNAGGTILPEGVGCWSSSEDNPGVSAYGVLFNSGYASWTSVNEDLDGPVRACLAF